MLYLLSQRATPSGTILVTLQLSGLGLQWRHQELVREARMQQAGVEGAENWEGLYPLSRL